MHVHACGSRCAREGTSSEAEPARGRWGPSSEADLIRGGVTPRARRTLLEVALCWAALVGCGGRRGVDRVVRVFCVKARGVFCVFYRF
jgi:hypothetical protein